MNKPQVLEIGKEFYGTKGATEEAIKKFAEFAEKVASELGEEESVKLGFIKLTETFVKGREGSITTKEVDANGNKIKKPWTSEDKRVVKVKAELQSSVK